MDRSASRGRFDKAACASLLILLSACASNRGLPPPEPIKSICSIPYPPTLTREEAQATPKRLGRWTSGTKRALENNGCPL